ncbi:GNAT family N-acetyltransferase [Brevibacillus ginsengisoli]|uniref:GNAT family N-acetyltransferase n=1 Tax=Brevibacillus ginsengisoli TaxID=363854 RepID=UPI003CF12249
MEWSLQLIKGFQKNEPLRKSFNELAEGIFGLNFEQWYQQGYWTDKYVPYSFVLNDQIIANVSVNKLNLVVNHERKATIQIGTVMTHPDYRIQGLSARLMNQVLEDYEGKYDLMYLFANRSVLEFYPKFGFYSMDETQFSMKVNGEGNREKSIRKLDVQKPDDLRFIYDRAGQRVSVSRMFGTIDAAELLMFYVTYVFPQDIYYLEHDDVIVICKHDSHELHLYDVISRTLVDLNRIINELMTKETTEVIFHFTPDDQSLPLIRATYKGNDNVLFVKHQGAFHFPEHFKHPLTSQA